MSLSGVELIAEERKRQIEEEGWTPEHDAQHVEGELAMAACYYAVYAQLMEGVLPIWPEEFWPTTWEIQWAKRQGGNVPTLRDLVKAGALVAAEIDRRLLAGESL